MSLQPRQQARATPPPASACTKAPGLAGQEATGHGWLPGDEVHTRRRGRTARKKPPARGSAFIVRPDERLLSPSQSGE